MTVRIVVRDGNFHKKKNKPTSKFATRHHAVDMPSPTVSATGIAGAFCNQYHLEDDGAPDVTVPRIPARPARKQRQLFDQEIGKPLYRVPLMAEIRKMKPNGLTVATTFAGAGGSSTGYRMAGYRIVYANEFVPAAQDSYRANMDPRTVLDGRDIKEVTAAHILKVTGMKRGELSVLDGSPPCQAFSMAGKREKGWGTNRDYEHGASQKNEELFSEYIRLLRGIEPEVFVAENVAGLVKGAAKGFFLEILAELKASRYEVEVRVLDAQWLGVPQARERVIFIGVRKDLELKPAFPTPLPYRYSVREAIPWIAGTTTTPHGYTRADQISPETPAPSVNASPGKGHYQGHAVTTVGRLKGGRSVDAPAPTVLGHNREHTTNEMTVMTVVGNSNAPHSRKNKRYGQDEPAPPILARRANISIESRVVHDSGYPGKKGKDITDKPSPTVTVGHANYTHFQVEQRVVHDPGRPNVKARDVTDEPSPTITAGGDQAAGGGPRNHFKVESRVMHDTRGQFGTKGDVTDRPAPSVIAARSRNFKVTEVLVQGGQVDQRNKGKPINTDVPAPAVVGGNAKKRTPDQFVVERRVIKVGASAGFGNEEWNTLDRAAATIGASPSAGNGLAGAGDLLEEVKLTSGEVTVEKRKFTIEELRRICAFPDDFVLHGTYGQQWERLGNSVPPIMMRAVAVEIRDRVLLPARAAARTAARPPRSRGCSTTGKRPKGAGKTPATSAAGDASAGTAGPRRRGRTPS